MVSFHLTGDALWTRMENAVEKVRNRLERTARTLQAAKIPFAVVGGNAVRAWVAQADEAAVRNTRDVGIHLRREDLPAAMAAMQQAGFIFRHVKGIDMFLDGTGAKARDAVHVIFASERIRSDDLSPAPEVSEIEAIEDFPVLKLEALVRMKLTSFRDKDPTHLRDMIDVELIDVELIDTSWLDRLSGPLAERLQYLIETPDG
jgi:hypothetical protein